MVILLSDTIEFKTKKIIERHFTMIKVLITILICMCLIREIENPLKINRTRYIYNYKFTIRFTTI